MKSTRSIQRCSLDEQGAPLCFCGRVKRLVEASHDAESVQHRHALEAVAREQGFASWNASKVQAETAGFQPPHSDLERAIDGIAGIHLSRWFSEYGEAAMHHAADGGFRLPYRSQLILMDGETVRALAFDPADPD